MHAIRSLFCIALLALPVAASANGSIMVTQVKRLLVQEGKFGGCMAQISPGPESIFPGTCPTAFVSFGCDGSSGGKDFALRKFELAQLSYALRRSVFIVINESQAKRDLADGYCFVERIDLLPVN